jgi:DNA adenine methylase
LRSHLITPATKPQQCRPFLRWAGSKRQLLSRLTRHWSPILFRRYVEPFVGSASLFFYLSPDEALLGDINSELISTYMELRDNLNSVLEALSQLKPGKDNYYKLRAINPLSFSPPQRAARFIFLNRQCFNGLYRTNTKGQFNVPYGESAGAFPTSEHLTACSKILGKARLMPVDFEITLEETRPGDFVYLDPPFQTADRRIFKEYYSPMFRSDDLVRLKICMNKLTKKGIHFLASYNVSDEGTYLAEGYETETCIVNRNIAGFASNRRQEREILISNHIKIC